MNRKFIGLILILISILGLLPSCAVYQKNWSQTFTYQDPQTIGGKWDVTFDNGDVYLNVECRYWGTDDDTSVWETPEGKLLIQSGNIHAVQHSY